MHLCMYVDIHNCNMRKPKYDTGSAAEPQARHKTIKINHAYSNS